MLHAQSLPTFEDVSGEFGGWHGKMSKDGKMWVEE